MRVCFLSILFYVLICFPSFFRLTLSFGNAVVIRPCLDKVYLDRIDEVCAFPRRTFHDLVTLSRLAAWGLGPLRTAENLSHEETTLQSKCRPHHFASFFLFFFFFFFLIGFPRRRDNTMRENKEKTVTSGDEDVAAPLVVPVTSV